MADLKASNQNVQKNQKWIEEKKQLEQELDETRKNYEVEINKLKEKVKHQGTDSTQQNESVLGQASAMKSRYEERIGQLEDGQGPQSKEQLIAEVKKVMSSVYHSLKGQFEEKTSYDGVDIHKTIMATIKEVTLQMMVEEEEESEDASKASAAGQPQGEQVIQDSIVSATAHTTGDRGNPYYAAELEQPVIEEPMFVATTSQSTGAIPKSKPTNKHSPKKEVIASVIKPAVAATTGDKGNPYYAKELNQNSNKKKEKKAEAEIFAGVIKSAVAPSTGDKGNPYYAAELNKQAQNKEDMIEVPLVAASVSQTSGIPPQNTKPDKSDKKGSGMKDVKADMIQAAVAASTGGDKGNPYYAKELDKAKKQVKPEIMAAVIKPAVAATAGDKGNIHYAKELNKHGKVQADHQQVIEEPTCMVAASTQQTSAPLPPKATESQRKSSKSESKSQPSEALVTAKVIKPAVAPSTGGGGNPYYAKELDQHGILKEIGGIIKKESSPITGDKGNPYYAEELKRKEEKSPEKSKISEPKKDSKDSENKNQADLNKESKTEQKTPDGNKGESKTSKKTESAEAKKDKSKDTKAEKPKDKKDPKSKSSDQSTSKDSRAVFGSPGSGSSGDLFSPSGAGNNKGKKEVEKDSSKSKSKALLKEKPDKPQFGDDLKDAKVNTTSQADSDDDLRAKPPPLFGDEEEDDDLDWLS